MSKHDTEIAAVLDYVATHPNCTAREVSVAVFGAGKPRTTERSKTHKYLTELQDLGKLSYTRGDPPDVAGTWALYREPVKRKLQWCMCPHDGRSFCEYCIGGD